MEAIVEAKKTYYELNCMTRVLADTYQLFFFSIATDKRAFTQGQKCFKTLMGSDKGNCPHLELKS